MATQPLHAAALVKPRSAQLFANERSARSLWRCVEEARFPSHALVMFAALALLAVPVRASDDFEPTNAAWNGLTELVALAREEGGPVIVPHSLRLADLTPADSLLIVHPRRELPIRSLTTLLRSGTRVALADDSGTGEALLQALHIGRHAPLQRPTAYQLRGNPNLLIARPMVRHGLTEGVQALVANHPKIVHHAALGPLFAFEEKHSALVLAGAVGAGRFVAIGDSSVLINNMLEFSGNRRFVRNLIAYLTGGRGGRLYLCSGNARIEGAFGFGPTAALTRLERGFRRLAKLQLPPQAVRVAAMVVLALVLVLAWGALPRRSPYENTAHLRAPAVFGGLVGKVALFSTPGRRLVGPVLALKGEIEAELREAEARGRDDATLRRLQELLLELDGLCQRSESGRGPDANSLRAVVASSRSLFEQLHRPNSRS